MGMVSSNQTRAAIILGLCAGTAGLVYLATRGSTPPAEPAPAPIASAPSSTGTMPTGAASTEAASTGAMSTGPDATAPAGSASDKAQAAAAPSVDVVRVEPGGSALVAGRADPGATITLYAGDSPVADAQADAQGNFVAMFQATPTAEPQSLTIGATGSTGAETRSEQVVVLLPSAPPQQAADAATPAATAPEGAPSETAPSEATPPQTATPGTAAGGPAPQIGATAILSPDKAEITPTARPAGMPADRVSLASISYAGAGSVTLAGFGLAGAELKAYVNDALAREGQVDPEGRWRLALDDMSAGLYRLRIDQIDKTGRVSSRIETPFQRDLPAGGSDSGATETTSVVVQPGNNLWTLARLRYGAGMLYTRIYAANSGLIRDPDMIYPGQIFRMPDAAASPGSPPDAGPDQAAPQPAPRPAD